MPRNMRWKWILIACVLFACIAGIIQFPKSKKELVDNWNKSIRLGLDLKGGTYLEMQIQVQDAFKAEADRAMERMAEAFRETGISHTAIERNEPNSVETAEDIQITVKGIQREGAADARRIARETLGRAWILLPNDGADMRLGIGKEQALKLRHDTVMQCIHTIQRKIDSLGIAETVVQQRGGGDSAEVLVQLPGVDDPVRVKEIIRTQAQLELSAVISGPYASQMEALSAGNGALPANARLVRGHPRSGNGETWWILLRSPIISGIDLRDARAEAGEMPGRWDTGFVHFLAFILLLSGAYFIDFFLLRTFANDIAENTNIRDAIGKLGADSQTNESSYVQISVPPISFHSSISSSFLFWGF